MCIDYDTVLDGLIPYSCPSHRGVEGRLQDRGFQRVTAGWLALLQFLRKHVVIVAELAIPVSLLV